MKKATKFWLLFLWSRRDSNPGPNMAIVEPSTCLDCLNFRAMLGVSHTKHHLIFSSTIPKSEARF